MRKIIRNIPVLFLWLASLAIVAHMVIPHDHHTSESTSDQDESCPVSHNQTGHKTSFPVHCHAFNDLTTDKARPIQIAQNLNEDTIVFNIFSNSFEAELTLSGERIITFNTPIFNYFALDLSLLRAPPVFA